MNSVFLKGRVANDIELKTMPNGRSAVNFSVAVPKSYKNKDGVRVADFFDISAFANNADFIAKYFKKGSAILIEGALQTRSWEKDGQKHRITEVLVNKVDFADSAKTKTGAPATGDDESHDEPAYETVEDGDNDLPF